MGTSNHRARACRTFVDGLLTGKGFRGRECTCPECNDVFQKTAPVGHKPSQCSVVLDGHPGRAKRIISTRDRAMSGLAGALDFEGSYGGALVTSGRGKNATSKRRSRRCKFQRREDGSVEGCQLRRRSALLHTELRNPRKRLEL